MINSVCMAEVVSLCEDFARGLDLVRVEEMRLAVGAGFQKLIEDRDGWHHGVRINAVDEGVHPVEVIIGKAEAKALLDRMPHDEKVRFGYECPESPAYAAYWRNLWFYFFQVLSAPPSSPGVRKVHFLGRA